MRVLRPLRPGGEGALADQRHQQRLAEGDVEPGDRQDDEAGRRHPVHEALERVEAHDAPAGIAALELHLAADRDRTRPGRSACRGSRSRRSSAASPRGTGASRGPPGWIRLPDFWSGMLTRPLIEPPDCSALRSCCSFTALAVGLTEPSGLRCALAGSATASASSDDASAPMMKRACARQSRHAEPPLIFSLCRPERRRRGVSAAPRRRLRSRSSRDTRSASPRRRSRSRACVTRSL